MNQNNKIKAVVFDADGMVVKGDRPSLRLARDYHVPMEKLNLFFDNEFKDCVLGKRDLKEAVAPYLPKWGWEGSVEDFLHFWFTESYHNDEEVISVAKKLKSGGIICILATNQERLRVSYMKNQMGLSKVFDHVIASSDIGYRKPQVEFLEAIMKLLPGISPSEVLYFDDREANVESAKMFGFQTKLYKSNKDMRFTL